MFKKSVFILGTPSAFATLLLACKPSPKQTVESPPSASDVSTATFVPNEQASARGVGTGTLPPASTPTAAPANTAPDTGRFGFDDEPAGGAPRGFTFGLTGGGKQGRWIVEKQPDAPSATNALGQVDPDDTDSRFPIAVAPAPALTNVRLSVKCKMVSGKVDQACGLVLRYQDQNNYYVTRANALEGNVRFYFVKDGRRKQLDSWSGEIAPGVWHDYRIEARADQFEIFWNGKKILTHRDQTFSQPGRIGVWTKADSVTYFDDLRAQVP